VPEVGVELRDEEDAEVEEEVKADEEEEEEEEVESECGGVDEKVSSMVIPSSDVALDATDVLYKDAEVPRRFVEEISLDISSVRMTLKDKIRPWMTLACGLMAGASLINLSLRYSVSAYWAKVRSSESRSVKISSVLLSKRVDLKEIHADCSVWLNLATVPSSIVVGKF
jgi:hypothetical protein